MSPVSTLPAGSPIALEVLVEEVTPTGLALVIDHFGKRHQLAANVTPSSGARPRAGEVWIIDRRHGPWNFADIIKSLPPSIVGDVATNTALGGLLAALAADGLIRDETTGVAVDWIAVVYNVSAGWNDAGGGYAGVQYRVIGGYLEMKGVAARALSPSYPSTLLTLEGVALDRDAPVPAAMSLSVGGATGRPLLTIKTTGEIVVSGGAAGLTNLLVSFEGIRLPLL